MEFIRNNLPRGVEMADVYNVVHHIQESAMADAHMDFGTYIQSVEQGNVPIENLGSFVKM